MNTSGEFDRLRSLALDGDLPGMAAALDGGVDVNAANDSHQTVFMHCCANNRLAAARLLADRGADVNRSDHGGSTPMDFASRYASRDFCDWLRRIGGREYDSTAYTPTPGA